MKRFFVLFASTLLSLLAIAADKKPGEAASIQSVDFKGVPAPGAKVTAVVKVKLDTGYHVHSHKPSEPNFIATVLTLDAPSGVKAGEFTYPKGKKHKVDGVDLPLSVYEKEFEISVPLTLGEKTALPLLIPATLRYQACQGAQCYPPQRLRFEIKLGQQP